MDNNGKALVALIGAPAALVASMLVSHWEGTKYVGYNDVVGVATYCTGVTGPDAVVGRKYTKDQCEEADAKALLTHAIVLKRCTPGILPKPNITGAALSFTYNVGVGNYCSSTAARKFNAKDYRGGCLEMAKWNKAHGRVVKGLINRRIDPVWGEVTYCLKDT